MLFSQLQAAMSSGATLLTPTQRAARVWRDRLVRADHTLRPNVLPWGAWTASLWQAAVLRGDDDRVLLNPQQNRELWAQVLRKADPDTPQPTRSLVRLCVGALQLLGSHGGREALLATTGAPSTDFVQFAHWFRAFWERCQRERLLPASLLDEALTNLHTSASPALLLVGFDDLSPARTRLLAHFESGGTPVEHLQAADLAELWPAQATLLTCKDEREEWEVLAGALGAQLHSKAASVLVVLPDLEQSRPALERQLRETLLAHDPASTDPPWEFSEGRPLNTLALAADALALLRWTTGPVSASVASTLLRSPCLQLGPSLEEAAELDASIFERPYQVSVDWSLLGLAARCPSAAGALRAVAVAARGLSGAQMPSTWAERSQEALAHAGWPGSRTLSSNDYQAIDRWNDLMDSLSSLDLFERTLTFPQFLGLLEEGADDLQFAPQNRGVPIQILTPNEAAGIPADVLWFAHADEQRWSGRRVPSPLLPIALQEQQRMPGTDPELDGEAHQRTTERLLRNAARTTISYAASNAAGEMRPAAVFRLSSDLQATRPERPYAVHVPVSMETVQDDVAPPFPADTLVPGGVAVLKSQAQCPFRAFAERRLFSTEPQPRDLGFDARDRGNLLHTVLDGFWRQVRSQAELLRLQQSGELAARVEAEVEAALPSGHADAVWSARYVSLQRRRLHTLVMRWLEFEAGRPTFNVTGTERVEETRLDTLRLHVRVDRIDAVDTDDGEPAHVLIDYKTGSPSARDWSGERPDEPQLPFYAVAAGIGNVQAIAFGAVKQGAKMGFTSLPAKTPLLVSGSKHSDNLHSQLEEWTTTLHQLGRQFAVGDARVDPKNYPATCEYCTQRMLCRLQPSALPDLLDEEAGEVD